MVYVIKLFLVTFGMFYGQLIVAANGSILDQLSKVPMPENHVSLLAEILSEYQQECDRISLSNLYFSEVDTVAELYINPRSIYRMKIHKSGLEATIFYASLDCGRLGDVWGATGAIKVFVLVNDLVFENWLSAPPETVILEGKEVVLILPLLRDDCNVLDTQSIIETSDGCYGAIIWNEDIESFFGHGYPLRL